MRLEINVQWKEGNSEMDRCKISDLFSLCTCPYVVGCNTFCLHGV